MIPIEQLRIGSWVKVKENNFKIISIPTHNSVQLRKGTKGHFYEMLKNVEPIAINEKHLIELGFDKIRHDKFKDAYLKKDLSIEVLLSNVNKTDNMVFKGSEILKMDLKLHQLQNLITDLS